MQEKIYWREALLVLGVTRCESLLLRIGVPPEIAARPSDARRAVVKYFSCNSSTKVRFTPFDETLEKVVQSSSESIRVLHHELAEHYGPTAAVSFYHWAYRHFVDREQVSLWYSWRSHFRYYALAVDDQRPYIPLPFSEIVTAEIGQVLKVKFGYQQLELDEAELECLYKIPLSPAEQELVALERVEGDPMVETDVLLCAKLALASERTYQIWILLWSMLDNQDRESILKWGLALCALLEIPSGGLALPSESMLGEEKG